MSVHPAKTQISLGDNVYMVDFFFFFFFFFMLTRHDDMEYVNMQLKLLRPKSLIIGVCVFLTSPSGFLWSFAKIF